MTVECFDSIYAKYYKLAMKIAYEVLKDSDLAQDVTQELFVKMFQCFDEVDETLIKAWISLNARRKAIDFGRKNHLDAEIGGYDERMEFMREAYISPEMIAEEMDKERLRHKICCGLKEKNSVWYELLMRVVLEKEDPALVAEELGMSLTGVRTSIHRTRVWIRKNFGIEYERLK